MGHICATILSLFICYSFGHDNIVSNCFTFLSNFYGVSACFVGTNDLSANLARLDRINSSMYVFFIFLMCFIAKVLARRVIQLTSYLEAFVLTNGCTLLFLRCYHRLIWWETRYCYSFWYGISLKLLVMLSLLFLTRFIFAPLTSSPSLIGLTWHQNRLPGVLFRFQMSICAGSFTRLKQIV